MNIYSALNNMPGTYMAYSFAWVFSLNPLNNFMR